VTDPSRMVHLLIVEDDQVDAENIARAFSKGKLTNPLQFARDGIEALEILRADGPPARRRIILLDINMPRMNGLELLREMRSDAALRGIPVVVLTTSNNDRDRFEAYDLQVAGYLLKPVIFQSFVDTMIALDRYWALVEFP